MQYTTGSVPGAYVIGDRKGDPPYSCTRVRVVSRPSRPHSTPLFGGKLPLGEGEHEQLCDHDRKPHDVDVRLPDSAAALPKVPLALTSYYLR